jgi:hypothetical protein
MRCRVRRAGKRIAKGRDRGAFVRRSRGRPEGRRLGKVSCKERKDEDEDEDKTKINTP